MHIDTGAARRVGAIITIIRHAIGIGIGVSSDGATRAVDRGTGRGVRAQIDFVRNAIRIAIHHRRRLRLHNTGYRQQQRNQRKC